MRGTVGLLATLLGCDRIFGITKIVPEMPDATVTARDASSDASVVNAPPLIQEVTASVESALTLSVALPNAPASGDELILIGGALNGVTTVSGGGVGAWQLAAASTVSPTVQIWFGVTDGAASNVVITAATQSPIWASLGEWSGLSTVLDGSVGSGSAGGTPGVANLQVITTSSPDLMVFAVSCYGTIGSPASVWTSLDPIADIDITQHAWYLAAGAPGAHAVQVTVSTDWDAALAAFRVVP